MARKYKVEVRHDDTGKLIIMVKLNVTRKEQAKGRIAGEVDEKLFVDEYEIIYPKKRNRASVDRASLITKEFGDILEPLINDYRNSTDPKRYDLQSFFADLAMLIHDTFDLPLEKSSAKTRNISSEADLLNDVLMDQKLLEK